jgi:WD40 repeat protein
LKIRIPDYYHAVDFSPNSRFIYFERHIEPIDFLFYDLNKKRFLSGFEPNKGEQHTLMCYSENNEQIAFLDKDSTIVLYNLSQDKIVNVVQSYCRFAKIFVSSFFDNDSKLIFTKLDDFDPYVYSIPDLKFLYRIRIGNYSSYNYSKDKKYLIYSDTLNKIHIFDLIKNIQHAEIPSIYPDHDISHLETDINNKYLGVILSDPYEFANNYRNTFVAICDLETNSLLSTNFQKYRIFGSVTVQISTDDEYAISSNGGNGTSLLKISTGEITGTYNRQTNNVIYTEKTTGFLNEPLRIFTYNSKDYLEFYDPETNSKIDEFHTRDHSYVKGNFASKYNNIVAIFEYNNKEEYNPTMRASYHFYDIDSNIYINSFSILIDPLYQDKLVWFDFTESGNYFVIATTRYMYVYDIFNGTLRHNSIKFTHDFPGSKFEISEDNKYIISGHESGSIGMFDFETSKFVSSYPCHHNKITDVCIIPDTDYLLSSCADGTICVSNFIEGTVIDSISGEDIYGIIPAAIKITNDNKNLLVGDVNNNALAMFEIHLDSLDNETPIEYDYAIYPNPASETLRVEIIPDIETDIEIFNSLGMKVYSIDEVIKPTINIDISGFSKGVYFISLRATDHLKAMKFLKY